MLVAELLNSLLVNSPPLSSTMPRGIPESARYRHSACVTCVDVLSFEGKEPNKTTIVIDDRESISETVRTGYLI